MILIYVITDIVIVGSPISTKDKANLEYINGCKPHLISRLCGVELSLKTTS